MSPETQKPEAVAVVPPPPADTPEQIMAKIPAAGASGDLAEVIRLGNQLKKHQADIMKAEAEKLKKEAEEMAGVREKLEANILKAVKPIIKASDFLAVKAKGFTLTVDRTENEKGQLDPNGTVRVTGGCKLIVPTVKAPKAGGGGGSTGALKAQTGLSRHEIVDQYATNAEKAAIAEAEAGAATRPDSARYTAEKPVIKRILAENPHLIKH